MDCPPVLWRCIRVNVGVQIMRLFYTLAVAVSSNRSPLRGVVAIAIKNSALAGGLVGNLLQKAPPCD
jgi:hypothetical protein